MDIWGVNKIIKIHHPDARRQWWMRKCIGECLGWFLLCVDVHCSFGLELKVEILWKLREVVSRMEIGSSFRRFISTTDYWWICWWGHYPLLVFMTQQHYMALVLLGSELNAAHSCTLFSNQKDGCQNGGRDQDSWGMVLCWFRLYLIIWVCLFISSQQMPTAPSCHAIELVLEVSCSDWNGFFRWEFIKSQASFLQRFLATRHRIPLPEQKASSGPPQYPQSSAPGWNFKQVMCSLDCHPREINLERALYNDTMSIPSPQVSRKTQFFKTYFEATSSN